MAQRILIAEDHAQLAASLAAILNKRGYQVTLAEDGVTALTQIVQNPPDLLILDLRMPRLHGIELLKKLRQSPKTKDLPVIISTGVYKGEKYIRAAQSLGVRHYLEKPFKAAALLSAIEAELEAGIKAVGDPLPRHLARALLGHFSGRIDLCGGDRSFQIDLLQGRPAAIHPGISQNDFGSWLQQRGVISAGEYAYYRHGCQGRHTSLVEMGCLEYPELLQEKLAYLTAELVAGFSLPPLEAKLTPFPLPENLQVVAVNVPRILYEGFHRHPPKGDSLLTAHGTSYVALADNYYRFINFLRLNEDEKLLLKRLTGRQTLQQSLTGLDLGRALLRTMTELQMLSFTPTPAEMALPGQRPIRVFFNDLDNEPELTEEKLESFGDVLDEENGSDSGFRVPEAAATASSSDSSTGSLADAVRQTHAELKGKNYYEVFGLRSGDFSFDRLKQSYFALTRQFGPEALMQLGGEEAGLIEDILSTVTTAYNTLSDVVKKENYDQMLGSDKIGLGEKGDDSFQAQVQFQSGKTFLDMEEWDDAERAIQDACNIDPNNGTYMANLAWVIYKNPKNEQSRAMRDKARQMLARALTLERTAEAFAFKGWMHLDAGQDSLAESEFGKAMKLDPRQLFARRGLRQIEDKREQEKRGLFKRMFK